MSTTPVVLMVTVERRDYGYGGHYVYLGGALIGSRPYDGSDEEEIADEVVSALAFVVSERLNWKEEEEV